MDGQGQDGHAEAESRGDEGFADAAGNGDGLAGLDIEDLKARIMPLIVPKSPKSGAMVTMTDR